MSRLLCGTFVTCFTLSATACGGKDYGVHEKGVANPDTAQTEFAIIGAQSALSPGYTELY